MNLDETQMKVSASEFGGLSGSKKARFLARVAHMETIHARAAQFDNPSDTQSLFRSNEFIHRLTGYIMHAAISETEPNQDESVFQMIVNEAERRGESKLQQILEWLHEEHLNR